MKTAGILIATVLLVLAGGPRNANAQTLTTIYTFCSVTNANGQCLDGRGPQVPLIQGSDGNFYGTTDGGGTNGVGTVFRITPEGQLTTLYQFGGFFGDGREPFAGLAQGTNGNFYGTTFVGGTNDEGTVFTITPGGQLSVLYQFGVYSGYIGTSTGPKSGVVQGADGNFYGTTTGDETAGTVFMITPEGDFTTIYNFCSVTNASGQCLDGNAPEERLVQGSDGNLYGSTARGGANNWGTLFMITPGGKLTTLYSFCSISNEFECLDGTGVSSLIQGSDRNFYGTTGVGGTNGGGTVFMMTPSGELTTLHSFCVISSGEVCADGNDPNSLIQGSDGSFYGTTYEGGTADCCLQYGDGTAFQITSDGALTPIWEFTDGADGAAPGGLLQGRDGNFYGIAGGTVFRLVVGLTSCGASISPTNADFGTAGSSDSVSVTASNGCAWTATSNDGFIAVTSGGSGSGNGTVHYTVTANTSTTGRSGTIAIAGQTFTVTQAGASGGGGGGGSGGTNCTFTLSPTSVTLPAKGGTKTVKVKAKGTSCSWAAVSNNDFITIIAGASGSGNGTVDYSVSGNTNTTTRSGTITIAGQTFTVNQAAGGCTFTLSPKNAKYTATGGSKTVKVKANLSDCAWTAVTTNDFITITGGATGVGNGTVSYTVAANTNTTAVTGAIAIGGQSFAITESGAK